MDDSMHGSIFIFLKRFVEHTHNYSTWVRILEQEGLDRVKEPCRLLRSSKSVAAKTALLISGNQDLAGQGCGMTVALPPWCDKRKMPFDAVGLYKHKKLLK